MTQTSLATIETGSAILQQQHISDDVFRQFEDFIEAAPSTVKTYTRAIRQLFHFLQAKGISRPTRDDLKAFRDELTAAGKKPTTRQNYIIAVRKFFAWTADAGIYPNIADGLKGAKIDKEFKRDAMTSTQMKDVLKTARQRTDLTGLRDYAILALMLTCGLRTIEVVRANIGDMRTLGDNTVLYVQGKGHDEKADFVPMSPKTEKIIRTYLTARGISDPNAPLFASRKATKKDADGNRHITDGRMDTRSVSRIAKDSLNRSVLSTEIDGETAILKNDRLTAHSFRHTAATQAYLNGATIEEVSQFMRHAKIDTTKIYLHALDKAKNSCSQRIADSIL